MHTQGAAFSRSLEGPPDKGNAAPAGNRDGANNVKKQFDKYASPNSPSTGRRTGSTKKATTQGDGHNVVRLRPRELRRLYKKRYGGTLPDNEEGRRLAAIMLDHLVYGLDGHREATVFLIRSCPWMAAAERADAIARAFRDRKFWDKSELGDELWLTWEERDACRITTIRPFWATEEDMDAFRKEKNTVRMREDRRLHPKPKKQPLPVIRAELIAELLKLGERCTVKDLCAKKKRIRLGHLEGKTLADAVHRAIVCGIELGLFRKDVVEQAGRLPVAWITKVQPKTRAADTKNYDAIQAGTLPGHSGDKSMSPRVPQAAHTKNLSIAKPCAHLRVLNIEDGLPRELSVGRCLDERTAIDDNTGCSNRAQIVLGGRVALSAPPALAKTFIGHPASNSTSFGKEGSGVVCLEGRGTNVLVPSCPPTVPGLSPHDGERTRGADPTAVKPAGPPLADTCGTKRPGNRLVPLPKNDFPLSAAGVSPVRASVRT